MQKLRTASVSQQRDPNSPAVKVVAHRLHGFDSTAFCTSAESRYARTCTITPLSSNRITHAYRCGYGIPTMAFLVPNRLECEKKILTILAHRIRLQLYKRPVLISAPSYYVHHFEREGFAEDPVHCS